MFFACTDSETYFNDDLIDVTPNSQIPLAKRSDTNINEGQFSPDYEFLKEIEKFLASNDEFLNYQHQLVDNFGKLMWSHAILDVTDESKYLLSLPFIKNEKYSGLLIVTGHRDHIDLNFVQVNTLNQLIYDNNIDEIVGYLEYALGKLSYLEYIRNNRIIKSYLNTLDELYNFTGNEIEARSDVTVTYWTEGPERTGDGWALVARKNTLIIPCGGSGSSGGIGILIKEPRGPGGGGIIKPDPDDDDDEIVDDPLDSIDIDPDCENQFTNNALAEIATFIEEEFPCENELSALLSSLCEGSDAQVEAEPNSELLTDIVLDVNVFSEEDIEAPLSGLEWIDDSGLCDRAKCILKKIIGASSTIRNLFNPCLQLSESESHKFIFTSDKTDVEGSSTYNSDNPFEIPISISQRLCELGTSIQIAETLIHESIHAIIQANYSGEFDANSVEFHTAAWGEWINENYSGQDHFFMADGLFNNIANTLWELNGRRGRVTDYYGLILNGVYAFQDNDGNFLGNNPFVERWSNNIEINPSGLSYEEWVSDKYLHFQNTIINHPDGLALKFDCTDE